MKRLFDCEESPFPGRAADRRRAAARFARSLVLRAALACAALLASAPAAEAQERLNAALLTRDLGDPRQPGNVKLVLTLPPALSRMTANARADDFRVHVYPRDLSREEGLSGRYRADGIYLWRQRNRIFLDARSVPAQDREGEAAVHVVFAPGGVPLAEGEAEGTLRYTSDLVDVVLAVDVSRSMLNNDPQKRRVAAARSFIEMARQGGGIGHVGLVTFNHRAAPESPLLPLEEGETLIRALDRVGAAGMTNLDTPLALGMDELAASRKPVIILLTDGKNEGSVYRNTHLQAAERGVRIFTVGLSEQADHALLMEMAEATGGIYFRAVKDADLPEIYARLAAELGKRQMLRAETLRSTDGEAILPIDATVKRLVVLADGGARVGAGGGAGMFSTEMSGVLMGRPDPGEWTFPWSGAEPGVSTLALFGDTRFFLDVFPPQLLGDRLAVGATLAEGDRPLAGGSVWVEPIPGILDSRMELFDDGRHRDGEGGDGVNAAATVLRDAPRRFDMTVRASGTAGDAGDFVRQAVGLAIRAPASPPEAVARLEGDVDFGVLFPGETGTADVRLDLDARRNVDLDLDLSWDNAGPDWPDFASSLSVAPGRRALQLEIAVPRGARPGSYAGSLRVGDGDEIDERANARVTVGTVSFAPPGALDLGVVPPGTFVSRVPVIPYRADKAAALEVAVAGDAAGDVVATPGAAALEAGDGNLPLEIVVSAPMNRAEGGYAATVRVAAGPGAAEIPVVWRVAPLAAAAPSLAPLAGLPPAPDLPSGARPLERTPELSGDFWETGPLGAAGPVDSPWERTEQVLRTRGAGDDAGKSGFVFPEVETPSRSSAFWSAWWLYILAALLLLLLLLLLLAYILYRLGKSALARFLLASALANVILLIVFILLLGAGSSPSAARAPAVMVNLVADDRPGNVSLTRAEESLLDGTNAGAADAGSSGSGAMAAEAALAQAASEPAGGGRSIGEKQARLPEGEAPEADLSDAGQPSAMPLEERETRPLNRRDRASARNDRPTEMPENQLAEMAEPPPAPEESASAARAAENAVPAEARLEIEADVPSDRPVWSTGDKPPENLASDAGVLLAEAAGMETVSRDSAARRSDPPGRRRSPRETPAVYPEPRVEIDDPARDAFAPSANDAHDAGDALAEPGVEEVRVAALSPGADFGGEKPGAILPPGAYRLADSEPERLARGRANNTGDPELSRPAGGARASRGATGAREAAQPNIAPAAPSSSARNAANASAGRTGASGGAGAAAAEQRFDDAPSGAAGGGGPEGMAGASGAARASRAAGDGGVSGASPSPFASGGGAESAEYVPAEGSGAGREGGAQRNASAGRTGRSDSGAPQSAAGVPGGSGASRSARGDAGDGESDDASSRRSGRAGSGEGRFDDMGGTAAGAGRDADPSGQRSGAVTGGGADPADADDRPDAVSFGGDAGDWRRIERRPRSRVPAVAASAVDADGLLIVVGDFARLPDSASENLFGQFARRIGPGLTVEERLLSPSDDTLPDTLLALATPEQIGGWSEGEVAKVADYLKRGGHIWIDAAERRDALAALDRLAAAAGGASGALPATHPLADRVGVDALALDGKPAAVATWLDWRKNWRFADSGDAGTMRFLTRAVNYFLSGDADAGIVLEPGDPEGGTLVQPYREIIPDMLAGAPAPVERTALWDDFGPETSASWRMPSWSDAGRISAISDGQGGRALKLDLDAAVKGRAAAYRTLQPTQDFSGASAVTLDAYYDGAGGAGLSMVFTVGEDGTWRDYESRRIPLRTGWNSLRFDLDGGGWRSLTPGGTEDGTLPASRAGTGRAGFFVYRDGESAAIVLFRGIRTVRR